MPAPPEIKARLLRHLAHHPSLPELLADFTHMRPADAKRFLLEVAQALAPAPPVRVTPPDRPRHLSALGPVTKVRVYSDGASRGNPGLAGAGAVLTTEEGEVIERLGKFLGHQTNNHAEYMGVILGLQHAQTLGAAEVEVYADSQLMIRQLSGEYRLKSPSLRPLYDEAVKLLRSFKRVKLVHVPREMNREADEMSNRAIDQKL